MPYHIRLMAGIIYHIHWPHVYGPPSLFYAKEATELDLFRNLLIDRHTQLQNQALDLLRDRDIANQQARLGQVG